MEFSEQSIMQTMEILKEIPFIKQLIKENKKLTKKNKELKIMMKLMARNYIDDAIQTPVHIKEEPQVPETPQKHPLQLKNKKIEEIEIDENKITEKTNVLKKNIQSHIENEVVDILNDAGFVDDNDNEISIIENDIVEIEKQNISNDTVETDKVDDKQEEVIDHDEEEKNDNTDESSSVEYEEVTDDEEDVFEIIIDNKTYYTSDVKNGVIYDVDEDGDISVEMGKLTNGKHTFYKNKKSN